MEKSKNSNAKHEFISRRERLYFSESARHSILEEIEQGLSKAEAGRRYRFAQSSIYKWIALNSKHYGRKLRQVVEQENDCIRLKKRLEL